MIPLAFVIVESFLFLKVVGEVVGFLFIAPFRLMNRMAGRD